MSSPFHKSFLVLLSINLSILSFQVNSQFSTTERTTLLNLKQQWGDPPSLQAWNSASSPCNWPEILCDTSNTTVTGLHLRSKIISQSIPSSICDLKNLTFIDMAYNNISGPFPTALYNCLKLQYLDLSQNAFISLIPADIYSISTLTYLDLDANNFTGDIPPEIGLLSGLQALYLHSNLFNGTFPAEIGNLSNLEVLTLAYNGFAPMEIPPEFGKLKRLKFLWLKEANLIGEIPDTLGNLSSLKRLDMCLNNLNGNIPPGLFLLKNLSTILLYNNRLSGPIPSVIESLNLTWIDLSANNLTGAIPESFGSLQQLELFNLFRNELTGRIPSSIGLIPALKIFRVFFNNLSGELPPEFGLHSRLEGFEVSDNQFTGKLPENLCAGGSLSGAVAFSNKLTGEIPKSLGNCASLRTVQLYNNNFSGEVPSGMWTSFNLSSLMLSNNLFSGNLPSNLAWNMSRLEISNNRFSGGIPAAVSSWTSLVVFKASNNLLSGKIPVELTGLSQVITLILDGNSFSGEFPSQILSWKSLTSLNLARNDLSGSITPLIGSLPDLLDLDLSENQFSGQIPLELGHLRLTSLNLSSNQLSGKIPSEFDNMAYENSFLNNPNLCAINLLSNVRSCFAKNSNSGKMSSKILAVILVLAIAVFLVTVVLTLFVVRNYRKKKHRRDIETWKLTSFQRLDFTEVNILSSLTENNMIGSGGSGKIYQIAIGRSGEYVAVKRIWSNRKLDHSLEREFLAEVQILGTIRHSNIVKLLCCISSENSKLLVYEYMENQSLDKWLHGKKRTARYMSNLVHHVVMDWPRRLHIAVGAAQGLCYMHHDCTPPIIHRDVKSSNILLDSEFNARIADFGLAKILAKRGEPDTMSSVAGSFGYLAPEYAYTTKVNEKIDVYSFGVVLLELVTGREPSDGAEHTSLAEWAWKHYGEGKPVGDMLDKEIEEPRYLDEMTKVFKLGLICTSTLPSSRPSVKEVLQILRRSNPLEGHEDKKVGGEYDAAPLLGNDKYLSSYKRSKKVSDDGDDSSV
ncbi:hypothetical protein RJ639_038713 [Escallonia herrerae]|uniref:Protein kinase domain-containing protein n=1 Tax=Escallonia herrerae TaxID=1293975 RepID=A0AA88WSI5_9ASTE|nr:hypothetical protein RJ639_038713 [Escallonia herrerae]